MTSPRLRPWLYGLGLTAFFAFLVFVPDLVRKRHYQYTASSIPVTDQKPFPMETKFPIVGSSKSVTLSELVAANPGGLLINFWATWCPPCLEELPSLEKLNRELQAKGDNKLPKLVTISVDEHLKEITDLHKTLSFKPTFLVLHDPGGAFAETTGSSRFPETYWVGPKGEIKHKWLGPQDWVSDAVLRRLASP